MVIICVEAPQVGSGIFLLRVLIFIPDAHIGKEGVGGMRHAAGSNVRRAAVGPLESLPQQRATWVFFLSVCRCVCVWIWTRAMPKHDDFEMTPAEKRVRSKHFHFSHSISFCWFHWLIGAAKAGGACCCANQCNLLWFMQITMLALAHRISVFIYCKSHLGN